jgi:hypothetical protein
MNTCYAILCEGTLHRLNISHASLKHAKAPESISSSPRLLSTEQPNEATTKPRADMHAQTFILLAKQRHSPDLVRIVSPFERKGFTDNRMQQQKPLQQENPLQTGLLHGHVTLALFARTRNADISRVCLILS